VDYGRHLKSERRDLEIGEARASVRPLREPESQLTDSLRRSEISTPAEQVGINNRAAVLAPSYEER